MSLSDNMIPGKCPACGGIDKDPPCQTCLGAGVVAFGIKKGFMFTKRCKACDQTNGISIRDDDTLDGQRCVYGNTMGMPVGPPDDTPVKCVWCGSDENYWELIGQS